MNHGWQQLHGSWVGLQEWGIVRLRMSYRVLQTIRGISRFLAFGCVLAAALPLAAQDDLDDGESPLDQARRGLADAVRRIAIPRSRFADSRQVRGAFRDAVAEASQATVSVRSDGKDVRYLPAPPVKRRSGNIDVVLLLSRQPDATPTLEPIEPLEAFSTLLESAFSAKGSISAPALKTFASAIEGAASFKFVYSNLTDAIAAIKDLTDE